MFYGHIYAIVTVHSMKDYLDQPLHHSYVMSSTTLLLPSEWSNPPRVNLNCKSGVCPGGGLEIEKRKKNNKRSS